MDDQTRSIIRNVKGAGKTAEASPSSSGLRGDTVGDGKTDMVFSLQFARTIFCACSSPNARPDACDKQIWWSGGCRSWPRWLHEQNLRAWIGAHGSLIPRGF